MQVRVDGTCDRRFQPVREAFESNFVDLDEVGAALCVHAGSRVVVDIWGGHVDAARTRPWARDTLVNTYSVGKGILAILALGAAERGEIRLSIDPERLSAILLASMFGLLLGRHPSDEDLEESLGLLADLFLRGLAT